MISDPCTRYGIINGCNEGCPVLNDGDCTIEETLAEESDWYAAWVEDVGHIKGFDILDKLNKRTDHSVDDFDRAMQIFK